MTVIELVSFDEVELKRAMSLRHRWDLHDLLFTRQEL